MLKGIKIIKQTQKYYSHMCFFIFIIYLFKYSWQIKNNNNLIILSLMQEQVSSPTRIDLFKDNPINQPQPKIFKLKKIIKKQHQASSATRTDFQASSATRVNFQSSSPTRVDYQVSSPTRVDQVSSPTRINLLRYKNPINQPEHQIIKLKKILNKQYQLRTPNDNKFIINFIKQNQTLSKLSEQISLQFVKNLFKVAYIVDMEKDKILYMKGQKIQDVGILLYGQLAVLKNQGQINAENVSQNSSAIFQKLLQFAKIYTKKLKKKQSLYALQNLFRTKPANNLKNYTPIQFVVDEPITPQKIYSYINHNEFIGFIERSVGQHFNRMCVCLNNYTSMLLLSQSYLMASLEAALKQKINKLTYVLRGFGCFKLLDIDRLQLIIQNMGLKKKKKGDQIYKQGQSIINFYLNFQGQIKIIKETNLLQQNPNILYGNRKKLLQQSLKSNKKQNDKEDKVQKIFLDKKVNELMLPYANLTSMYNFRPVKKNIQIGIVTPFCLFGEQEYGEKKIRDTSAICSSITAEYYEINVNKLQQILGNKLLELFRKQLRDTVRRKVLYRQSQYATSIQFQNNNNLDYFYMQGQKQKQSPRKFKISKMNNLISSKKQITRLSPCHQQPLSTTATYTSFNFNKMTRIAKTERKQKKQKHQSQDEQKYQQNSNQQKIIDVTHTWRLMKQKVDMQIKASKKISPFKLTINLNKPLIASQYFYHVQKQSKRISRQHRKRVTSLQRNSKYKKYKSQDSKNTILKV